MWFLSPAMFLLSPAWLLVLHGALLSAAGQEGTDSPRDHQHDDQPGFLFHNERAVMDFADPCHMVYPPCMSEADRFSLEALRHIHREMDDDQDGGIEVEESMEFIIEDLKQQQTNKHSNLHREDQHITIEELWSGWKASEVHNWTQEDVLRWLRDFVELPQYEKNFKEFRVNGNTLPRIAANEPSFLSVQLKILDQRDKQKLNIKALDVVLFGPLTRPPHNYMKDLVLIVSVVMGVGGCWFAQVQNKHSKVHIARMMKDLDGLQRAEMSLQELQGQLELAQEENRTVAEAKQNLEEKMRDEIIGAQEEAHRLHWLREGAVSELSRLRYAEEELEHVRGELKRAENHMVARWSVSEALQLWLQLTHEVEVQYYNVKKQDAEEMLKIAKEEAEKIKKKRSSVLGTLHVAHSSSLDQVDHKILEAKTSLSEVTACLRERLHRWQQIERLFGFQVLRNSGLASLTATLYSDHNWVVMPRVSVPSFPSHGSVHSSLEDLIEDTASSIPQQMPGPPMKRSPQSRGGATVCRSRRSGLMGQPPNMMSSDPDILVPSRAPRPCFEEEEQQLFVQPQRRQYVKDDNTSREPQEMFKDSDFVTSPSGGRMYPTTTIDSSPHKMFRDEMKMFANTPVKKVSRDEVEASLDPPIHKISREELDASADMATRKMTRDKMETSADAPIEKASTDEVDPSMDAASRKISRDRGDVPSDHTARVMMLRDELGAPTEGGNMAAARKKLSRDMMGYSMDSGTRHMLRDDFELPLKPITRKLSLEMIYGDSSKRSARDKGDVPTDYFMRGIPRDKMADTIGAPMGRISQEDLEFLPDIPPRKMPARGPMELLVDSPPRRMPREKPQFLKDSTCAARMSTKEELEMSAGFHRRQTSRDQIDSSIDTPTGKICRDGIVVAMEMPKRRISREEFVESESLSSVPSSQLGQQPDLTLTSQAPWQWTTEPLSQVVYDGILEKSCVPVVTTATTPDLPQDIVGGDNRPPLQAVEPSPRTLPPETRGEEYKVKDKDREREKVKDKDRDKEKVKGKDRDKEKVKTSSKLKNLFKKKKDCPTERPQGGLQNL